MITRFRVEGKGGKKAELIEELSSTVAKIITTIGPKSGHWECTDDVISGDEKRGYTGRMVLNHEEGML